MELPARGIIPPILTPLTDQGQFDPEGMDRLVEHIISGGVSGLFALGTTGEAAALGIETRKRVLEHICRAASGRVPVLAGVSDTALPDVTAYANHAAEAGAGAVVVLPPYYLPVNQAELFDFFAAVAAASPLPVFIYNIPSIVRVEIEPETVARLADIENIVGIKDSSGNLDYFARIADASKDRTDWTRLVGIELDLVAAVEHGADGCVGAGANVWPKNLVDVYESAAAGKSADAAKFAAQQAELMEICKFGELFSGMLRGLKAALEQMQICGAALAPPHYGCNAEQKQFIRDRLNQLGLLPGEPGE